MKQLLLCGQKNCSEEKKFIKIPFSFPSQENAKLLQSRGVAYINADSSIEGILFWLAFYRNRDVRMTGRQFDLEICESLNMIMLMLLS